MQERKIYTKKPLFLSGFFLLIYGKNYPAEACGTKESFTYLADVVRTWLELDTEKKENKTESTEEIQAKEPPATKRLDDINDELWLPKF